MEIMLRIFFMGLIAFVPSEDGLEMQILLVDARDDYYASDGTRIQHHKPVLLARSGQCEEACGDETERVLAAEHLFLRQQDPNSPRAVRRLESILDDGGVWVLDGEELKLDLGPVQRQRPLKLNSTDSQRSLQAQVTIPTELHAQEDFSWVMSLNRLAPDLGGVDPDVLAVRPEKGLIASRMVLTEGTFKTAELVEVGGHVRRVQFRTLRSGRRDRSGVTSPIANAVVVEIPLSKSEFSIIAQKFGGQQKRTMKLSTGNCSKNCVIELAVLNLPLLHKDEHTRVVNTEGKHFELYYELANRRPPQHLRPIPVALLEEVPEHAAVKRKKPSQYESLLSLLSENGRSRYSHPVCPLIGF